MANGIRAAEERDIPTLCEIWKVCFCDNEDYVRFFYRENLGRITTTVYEVDGKPVSMLHWFDAEFVNGAERRAAKYLYSGGSLPEYRKNGYYGALIKYVTDYADSSGCVLFGKPATQRLIPYYDKFGFIPDALFRVVSFPAGKKGPLEVRPVSPKEYNLMRNRAFGSFPHAEWPDSYMEFCFAENSFLGGKALVLGLDGSEHFLIGSPKDGTLTVSETDLSARQLERISGALCDLFGASFLRAYLPDRTCNEGEELVSSVVYNAPLNNTYVNLLLI